MAFILLDELRAKLTKNGAPLYFDDEHGEQHVLLEIIIEAGASNKIFVAHPTMLSIYGKGGTKRKAMHDLMRKFRKICMTLPPPIP